MAGIGPFDSFAFPDVYTKTENEAPTVTAAGSLRFAAFVGPADEVLPINGYELFRGSSSMADNKITLEDVSSQVTGTNRNFQTTFFPIVTGTGSGTVTTNPNDVGVYVNGQKAPVATVDGANGLVYLMSFPAVGDKIEITYYFKRTDTLISNEDISSQADGVNKIFIVQSIPIVQGDNGGITTTDPSKVTVLVNGAAVGVVAVDGNSGTIALALAPAGGATVTATYYTNDYQDTYDILPSSRVANITKVGYSPTTQDFVQNADYVLDSTGTFQTINWGNSFKTGYGAHLVGSTYFHDQVSGMLFDNLVFRRPTGGAVDGTNKTFTLGYVPTKGTGQGKGTDSTRLISAYVGTDAASAVLAQVIEVTASNQTITLKNAPTGSNKVYVTQYHNQLPDDNWTLSVITAGPAGVGSYGVVGANSGTGYSITWSSADTTVSDPDFSTENVTYPNGPFAVATGSNHSDAQVLPGYGKNEIVKLTFIDSTRFAVTSSISGGSGSSGDNTGYLGQTYIDNKTGFRVTVMPGASVTYTAGDIIGYRSSPTVVIGDGVTQPGYSRVIPGLQLFVTDTLGTTSVETCLLNTYNKSGAEPNIGDFYYVSFNETKEFTSDGITEPVFVTTEKDSIAFTGPLAPNNRLSLAAHFAFLNGAPAMALLQTLKTVGGTDAPDSRYIKGIDAFNMPMAGGIRPALMEPVTTARGVLSYLKTSNTIQSAIRYANERMTYFGFANNTSPTSAMSFSSSMNSERMTAIYPDGAVATLTDELGNNVDYLMDGAILAAAMSGRDTSPAYDVAEPLDRKPVVGFTRLYRRMDPVTQAQVANSGVTVLEEQSASIIVKMGLTTDLTSVLTRTPSVIRIKDFIQKGTRSALQTYIGMKNLPSRTTEIEKTLSSYLSSAVTAQIITGFTGVKATVDPNDATIVRVVAYYSPVLPLLYIVVTYNLRSSV